MESGWLVLWCFLSFITLCLIYERLGTGIEMIAGRLKGIEKEIQEMKGAKSKEAEPNQSSNVSGQTIPPEFTGTDQATPPN